MPGWDRAENVGNVAAKAAQNAGALEHANQQLGHEASAFDVWTHSYEGMSNRMSEFANDPAGALANFGREQDTALAAGLTGDWHSSSFSAVGDSIAAQADGLGEMVNAIGEADGALATVGATFALLTGVEQMLSTLVSVIPFPALPAIRIMDMDVGLPHGHSHPPNLVPPAPMIPLPSTGPIIPIPILSGATRTLINGMPAARCGDMGLAIWCGGYFPMYEVFLGSSSVWIEGSRAGRLAVDITKHCMFSSPKPQDLPLGPPVGMTIMASGNVLIGGVPMPSLTSLAIAGAMKAFMKGLGKAAKGFSRATAPLRQRLANALGLRSGFLRCAVLRAEPVNIATGEVVGAFDDFSLPGPIPLDWERRYGSFNQRRGVCGVGWTCPADGRLVTEEDGLVVFYDGANRTRVFSGLPLRTPVNEIGGTAQLVADGDLFTVRLPDTGTSYAFPRQASTRDERLVLQVSDSLGNRVRYVRDDQGLREIIDSCGRHILVRSFGGLTRDMHLWHPETQTMRPLVGYDYSARGELIAAYDGLGQPHKFSYEDGRLAQHTDRNGLSFYYEYATRARDARCCHTWGDGGLFDYWFHFDPLERRIRVVNSLGSTSAIQLDTRLLPTTEIDPLGGTTRFEYDDSGRMRTVIDQAGLGTEYYYDPHGNPMRIVRPDGTALEMKYDASHRLVQLKDDESAAWHQEWDDQGLLVARVDPTGARTRFDYDRTGNLVAITDPNGNVTRYHYDRHHNLVSIVDALGNRSTFDCDEFGNVVTSSDALGHHTHYTFDATSRLTHVRQPGGTLATYIYDPEGNMVEHRDGLGNVTRCEYTALGEVSRRLLPDGTSLQYQYDTELRLSAVVNERGDTYALKRDGLGRVIEEVDYWGERKRYKYAANGHLISTEDALGRTTRYVRDALGRETNIVLPTGDIEQLTYDRNGRLATSRNGQMETRSEFDSMGRLVKDVQGGFTITYRYDLNGNRVERQTSDGNVVRYEYNELNEVTKVVINTTCEITIERDARGQITAERCEGGLRRRFSYDPGGRLASREVQSMHGGALRVRYRYDAAGNLVEIAHNKSGVEAFLFDPLGHIAGYVSPLEMKPAVISDPSKALADSWYEDGAAPDARIRVGVYGDLRYKLNANGEVFERIDTASTAELDWDERGRLRASRIRSGASAAIVSRYGYDVSGRRVRKLTHRADQARFTHFAWDGDNLISERTTVVDTSGSGVADLEAALAGVDRGDTLQSIAKTRAQNNGSYEYVYYPNTFEVLARIEPDRRVLIYHNDPNGAPREVTDQRGKILWQARYEPHGRASVAVANVHQPIRLQGQYADEESGLHYNRFRYFDPVSKCYLTKDPLGMQAGADQYAFARNTVGWTDPLGLLCKWLRRMLRNTAVGRLPRFSGRSRAFVERELRRAGFAQSATDPNVWTHVDGSYVRIDPPHDPSRLTPGARLDVDYRRSHVEPHVHKEWRDPSGARAYPPTYGANADGGTNLDDHGLINDDPGRTHIIIRD